MTCSEQHVNDCSQISKMKLCNKRWKTGVLYNKFLSSLVSPETPAALAPSFVSVLSHQPPVWALLCVVGAALTGAGRPGSPAANLGQANLCTETEKGYVQLCCICDIGMPRSLGIKPFKALCYKSHEEAFKFPWLLLANLTWATRTESFSFHCGSHYLWQVPPVLIFGWWQKWPLGAEWQGQLSRFPN